MWKLLCFPIITVTVQPSKHSIALNMHFNLISSSNSVGIEGALPVSLRTELAKSDATPGTMNHKNINEVKKIVRIQLNITVLLFCI